MKLLNMPKEPNSRLRDNVFRVKLMWQMSESASLLSLPTTRPLIFILLRAYVHVPTLSVPAIICLCFCCSKSVRLCCVSKYAHAPIVAANSSMMRRRFSMSAVAAWSRLLHCVQATPYRIQITLNPSQKFYYFGMIHIYFLVEVCLLDYHVLHLQNTICYFPNILD
jgi:hypothetical protein